MAGGMVAFEGELNAIVREFLDFNHFEKTLNIYDKECGEKGKSVSTPDKKVSSAHKSGTIQHELLRLLETGDGHKFINLWNKCIPETVRTEDTVAQKLEFYLNIYFAIYPLKYGTGDTEEGMNNFKVYLETRGASLSQTTEFLPFYALPFVPNPRTHPSYKELFAEKWVPDLKIRLQKFLNLILQSSSEPRLFQLYKGGNQGANRSDVQAIEQKALDAERKSSAFIKRFNRVQADYHNLISITADLVDSLESTVQGKPVSPEYLQQICMRLFSNQVRQSVDFTRPGTAGEVLRQSVVPPQGLQHSDTNPGSALDYDKIRKDIIGAAERRRALLLQSLRWKLTKASPADRETMLSAYIKNDILGCAHSGQYQVEVLKLFNSKSVLIEQYTARVFNAVASLCDGRSYLSQNPDLLKALMDNLKSQRGDSITQENILGCIQKLSLRRTCQSVMIEEGIIFWLVSILEDNDALSDYLLEYSVALLMNLCLRSAGKKKCIENAHKVLKVLSDLLGHENQEIIPYVNGTLYSILAIPSIREEAKAMGMEEILTCFIKEDQPDMNRQIEFIIKQLNSHEEPDDEESDEEDEDEDEEDQDAMEADLDKSEMIKPQSGELAGERLLNSCYVASMSAGIKKKKPTDAVANQEEVLRRPVTPGHMRSEQHVVHVQPKSIRPPTGRPLTARSSSRDINRPPTRSGSRPNTQEETPRPRSVPTDEYASDLISKATGRDKKLAKTTEDPGVKPSKKMLDKNNGADVHEYSAAFGTRPRIARTPDSGGRPTSRGSIGDGPTPMPKYSDSLPTPRPGSGGRPSNSGGNGSKSTKPRTPAAKSGRTKGRN